MASATDSSWKSRRLDIHRTAPPMAAITARESMPLASNRLPLTTQARVKKPSMPTRTYATDVYLTCPCPECEGREVRITLRKFRNLSPLPRQPATKPCISSCREAMTRPGSKAKSPPTSGQTPAGPEIPRIGAESRAARIDLAGGVIAPRRGPQRSENTRRRGGRRRHLIPEGDWAATLSKRSRRRSASEDRSAARAECRRRR